MRVLAIESSCDETAAAIVLDGRTVLANVISTQIAIHAEYGGVVPEIASRKHLEAITVVIEGALRESGCTLADLDGIVVTRGPGLPGALLVGISTAKALAYARGIPLIGVHHIEGHIFAGFLETTIPFPFLALIVSGGHTHLYRVDGFGAYVTLGKTLDDAAGEAFDKAAKLAGLPYPGGQEIDRRATVGNPLAIAFPRPLIRDKSLNFSFSGLKTAVLTYVKGHPQTLTEEANLNDLCAAFQAAVCDVLVGKTQSAIRETGIRRLVVAGGVACNSELRRRMTALAESENIDLLIPSPLLCTDNAAMLAVAGDYYLHTGVRSSLDMDSLPSWSLDSCSATREYP